MDKREKYLSCREREIRFERDQIVEEIHRVEKLIEDYELRISSLTESKDSSYDVFSASQVGSQKDSEIVALKKLVSDKIHTIEVLREKLDHAENSLVEIVSINQDDAELSDDDIAMKLKQIYQWIPVDARRAQTEVMKLIRHLEQK